MHYEVYPDILFAENLLMDYFVLRITVRLLSLTATRRKCFGAACFGAFAVVVWVLAAKRMPDPIAAFYGIGVTVGMVRSGCQIRRGKELACGVACFYLSAFLLGGAMMGIGVLFGTKGRGAFAAAGVVSYTVTVLLLEVRKRMAAAAKRTVQVILVQDGKWKEVKGLYDTGNALRDTTTGKPVSVISYDVICELFTEEMRKGLHGMRNGDPVSAESVQKLRPHYIEFRSVGCKSGMLLAVTISEMVVIQRNTRWRIRRPVLALTENSSSPRGYDMILHPDLMDR